MKLTPFSLVIMALALGQASLTQAQDKLLPPTYQVGKEYILETKQSMEMDMAAVGVAIGQPALAGKSTTEMLMEITARCKKHSVPDQRVVTTRIGRIKMGMNAMGMQVAYDSAEEGSEETIMGKQLGKIAGTEFTMILDAADKVISIDGLDELGGGGAGIDVEQLKQMANPSNQLGIPVAGVAAGETWKNSTSISLGGQVGKLSTDLDLKYSGDEQLETGAAAVVDYDAKMKLNLDAGAQGGLAGMKMKVEDGTMTGTMKIDKALRFVREGSADMEMTAKMGNPGNPNQELSIPMKVKQTVTLKSVTDI